MIRRLAAPLAVLVLALCVASLGAQPQVLGGELTGAANPRLAAAPDGSVHLVYQGRRGAEGAIGHRIWRDGLWGPEDLLAVGGDQFDPALAVGADGTVHVVWSSRQGNRLALVHRALRDSVWGEVTILDPAGVGDSEFPAVAARPDGGAEVVWQSTQGTRHLVIHASVGADGAPSPPRLIDCQNPEGFNIYPQLFLTPVPVVCWYQAVDGGFLPRAAERLPDGRWRAVPLDDLLLINPSRLPYLLLSDLGYWCALWHEADPRHERILFGRGGVPDLGLGEIVDANAGFDNVSPSAVAVGPDRWAVAWRGETPSGPEVFLAVEGPDGWRQRMLTGGQTVAPSQPALCAVGDQVVVVWTSDAREGGTGHLSHIALELR